MSGQNGCSVPAMRVHPASSIWKKVSSLNPVCVHVTVHPSVCPPFFLVTAATMKCGHTSRMVNIVGEREQPNWDRADTCKNLHYKPGLESGPKEMDLVCSI